MKIVFATKNLHKLKEVKNIIADKNFEILSLADFKGAPSVVEDGKTFEENAIKKALAAFELTGLPSFADDSGLEIDALNGRPGIYSCRYGGTDNFTQKNIDRVLSELSGIEFEKRTARFKCVVAFKTTKDIEIKIFEGVCEGNIGFEMKGDNGFGYDPIFVLNGKNITMAELSLGEKNRISHRARAIRKLEKFFSQLE